MLTIANYHKHFEHFYFILILITSKAQTKPFRCTQVFDFTHSFFISRLMMGIVSECTVGFKNSSEYLLNRLTAELRWTEFLPATCSCFWWCICSVFYHSPVSINQYCSPSSASPAWLSQCIHKDSTAFHHNEKINNGMLSTSVMLTLKPWEHILYAEFLKKTGCKKIIIAIIIRRTTISIV